MYQRQTVTVSLHVYIFITICIVFFFFFTLFEIFAEKTAAAAAMPGKVTCFVLPAFVVTLP